MLHVHAGIDAEEVCRNLRNQFDLEVDLKEVFGVGKQQLGREDLERMLRKPAMFDVFQSTK